MGNALIILGLQRGAVKFAQKKLVRSDYDYEELTAGLFEGELSYRISVGISWSIGGEVGTTFLVLIYIATYK